ncbi:unnamed protein product [Timema podura]|uniref:Uncharacterized protein n=1 Tax=Timema podura TaxID=61482 RepID=A0ABN7NEU6_TIMPD|nr:unnamed protein product [Timema podura]
MWAGEGQYSQWALNPSAYQNVSHEEVDWAALAQQWIQMKETCPGDAVPPAPPPPPFGDKPLDKKDMEGEGGEAPMDMDTKDDHDNSNTSNSQDASTWGSWQQWQQWGWNWSNTPGMVGHGSVPPVAPNKPGASAAANMGVPPFAGYHGNNQAYTTGVYDYNHTGSSEHYNQVMAGGYWSGGAESAQVAPPPGMGGPAPFIRQNRQDWRRSGSRPPHNRLTEKSDDDEDTTTMIDAAKRRQLPAWIREGLEKMEREKQKKLDRERQIKEREVYLQKKRQEEENALNSLNSRGETLIPAKSKFDSDSEDEPGSPTTSQSPSHKRQSRFSNVDSPGGSPPQPAVQDTRSREEIMQDHMIRVRRLLTEVLLEVTTEELEGVAQQVLNKFRAKGTALLLVTCSNLLFSIRRPLLYHNLEVIELESYS